MEVWLELDLHLPIESMSTTEGKADLFAVLEDSTEVTLQSSYDTDSTDSRIAQLMQRRHEASVVQNEQTERMAAIIGDNVAVPIPAVDRGRGDA